MGEKQGHTPGPWTVADGSNQMVHCGSQWIASTMGTRGSVGAANARLIAAAPDLLAAVWALVEHFERVDGDASHKAVIKQATDAIGKAANRPSATGEDSPANEGEA